MPNIVDIIEEYIKARINQSDGGMLLFRRSELAERFRCVPSQINYVLSTRFNFERGYIVETRRGGGGFVRIIQIPFDEIEDLPEIIYDKIQDQLSSSESISVVRHLYDKSVITRREAHLMEIVLEVAAPDSSPESGRIRSALLKSMLMVVLRHKK